MRLDPFREAAGAAFREPRISLKKETLLFTPSHDLRNKPLVGGGEVLR